MTMTQEYTLKGWVARDKLFGEDETTLHFGMRKPEQLNGSWVCFGEYLPLPNKMFPDLVWMDDPIEVELTIKKI